MWSPRWLRQPALWEPPAGSLPLTPSDLAAELASVTTGPFCLFLTFTEIEAIFLGLAASVPPYGCGFITLSRVTVVYSFHYHVVFHFMNNRQFT